MQLKKCIIVKLKKRDTFIGSRHFGSVSFTIHFTTKIGQHKIWYGKSTKIE